MSRRAQRFGDFIKVKRRQLGLTQSEVAQKVDVAQSYIGFLENNTRRPSNEVLKKLSKVLDLPVTELYFFAHPEMNELKGRGTELNQEKNYPPALQELLNDKKLVRRHHITAAEIDKLGSMRAFGRVNTKEDYIFLLMTIRQVFTS